MTEILKKEAIIPISRCDFEGLLGVPETFSLIMDLATEHAQSINLGISAISKKNLFWLAVRTRIHFIRRPKIEEKVTLSTWPEKPQRLRNNRSYLIEKDGQRLVEGKTEWAVLNTETNKLIKGDDVYPPDLEFEPESVFEDPFERVKDSFEEADRFASYTVRSTDIDLGGHMNNAAYLRALFSVFSAKERKAMAISGIDVRFVSPAYEGEELFIYRRRNEDKTEYAIKKADGSAVLLACMW